MSKRFNLSQILSITHGKLLCKFSDMAALFAFMLNEKDVCEVQMCAEKDVCSESLIKQLPFLSEIDCSDVNNDNYEDKLKLFNNKYGETHLVKRINESEE